MATVTPAIDSTGSPNGVPRVVWAALATGDTIGSYKVTDRNGLAMSVQISGTFGGATVAIQQSNDGTNWFPVKDISGTSISVTAAAMVETSNCAAYLRPTISGGTADAVNIYIVFRG